MIKQHSIAKPLFFTLTLTWLAWSNHAVAYENDLDGLLKSYVKPTKQAGIRYNGVNYEAWAKDPRHAKVKNQILRTNATQLKSKNEKLAYWINTYNLLTIDLITREKETESIKNLGSLFSSPWKKHRWNVNGKALSLDDIEHNIIRKLNDARIHFAINCAAKSCPDLRTEAYRSNKLDAQLRHQVQLTLNNSSKGFLQEKGNAVKVTKVMDWFREDFNQGNLHTWLTPYKKQSVNKNTQIRFFAYDWSLNKQ